MLTVLVLALMSAAVSVLVAVLQERHHKRRMAEVDAFLAEWDRVKALPMVREQLKRRGLA